MDSFNHLIILIAASKILKNLAVNDFKSLIIFLTKIKFSFDPQYTAEHSTCMIVLKSSIATLVIEQFFKEFTKK